jgi:hypothetical protein
MGMKDMNVERSREVFVMILCSFLRWLALLEGIFSVRVIDGTIVRRSIFMKMESLL